MICTMEYIFGITYAPPDVFVLHVSEVYELLLLLFARLTRDPAFSQQSACDA